MVAITVIILSAWTLSGFVVFASGMFPSRHRPTRLRNTFGYLVVELSMVVMIIMGIQACLYAYQSMSWGQTTMAIGAGLLAAPIVFGLTRRSITGHVKLATGLLILGIALNVYFYFYGF